MARIARRSLRLTDLPLFSLGKPWKHVADVKDRLDLRLYEPRYVELARRVLPPTGNGRFGYAECYPPMRGESGVLVQADGHRWIGEAAADDPAGVYEESRQGQVLLSSKKERRFRILSVREEEVDGSSEPLFVGHVQLLEDHDVARLPKKKDVSILGSKMLGIKAGSALVARQQARVFESAESWRTVGEVPAGVLVIAAGPPTIVEGYVMVPIAPSGAVELVFFREVSEPTKEDPLELPTAEDVKAVLLNVGQGGAFSEKANRGVAWRRRRRAGGPKASTGPSSEFPEAKHSDD
eukprot:TRINITY_DN27987_c0_g1_i2.p1 TRINITY_DN27987_c0_g1~~TRINITY_DN27987_c0_g1_i2.p1  ORF type:complete len:294 (-),score=62.84 TRINITY_DN27987_c0_g1_i2:28-909(-)